MALTYILIDFENVQPSAADLGRIRGLDYRVRLFHGPHQNKFDADVVRALQPLGPQVEYVQCERKGKNALDFRIAFVLGRLVHEREAAASPLRKQATFVVVSEDAGFDELLDHLRALGYGAGRVTSIRDALETGNPTGQPAAPAVVAAPAPLLPFTSGTKAAASKIAAKPDPRPQPAEAATVSPTLTVRPATKTVTSGAKPAKSAKKDAADPWTRAIANLRDHPTNRPATAAALVRHLKTVFGPGSKDEDANALVARLEREGVVTFAAGKATYRLQQESATPAA